MAPSGRILLPGEIECPDPVAPAEPWLTPSDAPALLLDRMAMGAQRVRDEGFADGDAAG